MSSDEPCEAGGIPALSPAGAAAAAVLQMQTSRRARRSLGVVLLLAIGCGGNGVPREQHPTATELVPLLPFTATVQHTEDIDFGTQLADAYLIAGWSRYPPDGVSPVAGSVAYIRSRRAQLFFHVADVAERTIELRCAAVGGKRLGIVATFRLNGTYIGRHVFPRDKMSSVALPAPLQAQRQGRNDLTIVAAVSRPIPKPIAERFHLQESALACEDLRFVGPPPSAPVARLEEGDDGRPQLFLPVGAAGEFYVQPDGGADLLVETSTPAPAGPNPSLTVELVGLDGDTASLFQGAAPSGPLRLALGPSAGEIALLRLRAAGTISGGLRIERLAIERKTAASAPPLARGRRSNVILYVIDTLRADHLGCYGYSLPTSPNLDALAREAVLFEDAVAQASWTRPALGSIMTGLLPQRHGAVRIRSPLVSYVTTLAEIMAARGYRTAAWVTNMNVSPRWGFDRGFGEYEYLEEEMDSRKLYKTAHAIHEPALAWIRDQGNHPFFLYLHASDIHGPYTPSEEWAHKFERTELRPPDATLERPARKILRRSGEATLDDAAWLASLYDAEVAEFDAAFGTFLGALKKMNVLDRTLLVVVSDHGEEFLEHGGFSHGRTLYEDQLRVPLLIRFPDRAGAGLRSPSLAQHVDILPTILDYLGAEAPDDIDGESLLSVLAAAGEGEHRAARVALSHTWLRQRELVATRGRRWKVILDRGGQLPGPRRRRRPRAGPEVYDRATDGSEQTNMATSQPEVIAYARQILAAGARGSREIVPERQHIDKKTVDRLRALGYVSE